MCGSTEGTLLSVIQKFLEREGILPPAAGVHEPQLRGERYQGPEWKKEQLTRLAHAVSIIPWGEARTTEEVLARNVGTCTGKHLLLQACFDKLGIEYRPVVCTFRWGEQKINLPSALQEILHEGEWVHGHNFVQIRGKGGKWIDLDITWDPLLKTYGFLTLPEDWDGCTPFIGLRRVVNRWDGVSLTDKKSEITGSLTPELLERRERFLREFIQWIDSLR